MKIIFILLLLQGCVSDTIIHTKRAFPCYIGGEKYYDFDAGKMPPKPSIPKCV